MANVSQRWKAYGNNRDENGAMGNGREPVRTPAKWGDLGRSKGGSDTVRLWEGEGWNGLDTSKGEVKLKTSEQLQKWRWRGSALEEDQSCDGKILSEGTWKPGKSRRNGPLTEKNGKVSARHATPNRETAAKGEKEGSSVEETGGMATEITQRVSAACHRRMPVKLKGTVHKTGHTSVDLGPYAWRTYSIPITCYLSDVFYRLIPPKKSVCMDRR